MFPKGLLVAFAMIPIIFVGIQAQQVLLVVGPTVILIVGGFIALYESL